MTTLTSPSLDRIITHLRAKSRAAGHDNMGVPDATLEEAAKWLERYSGIMANIAEAWEQLDKALATMEIDDTFSIIQRAQWLISSNNPAFAAISKEFS